MTEKRSDDKVTVDRADYEALKLDAERFFWYVMREEVTSDGLINLHIRAISGDYPSIDEWRKEIDIARKESK